MLKNKYRSLLLIFFLLLTFSIQFTYAKELPLFDTVITIDPGHGGRDPGTSFYNIEEKNINLEISKKLEQELSIKGAIVYMIRNSDVDLSSIYDPKKKRGDLYRRIMYIQKVKSDLYLSIHINYHKLENNRGAEVLYNSINKNNKILATSLMKNFTKDFNSKRIIKTTNLYLYKNTRVPGVLIECGFISNYLDRKILTTKTGQTKISKTITNGVIDYLKEVKKGKIVL